MTGIHWYGLRMADPYVDTQTDGSGWGMESVAWTLDGQEVSRCEMESSGGRHQWLLSNADTRLTGEFALETDAEGRGRLVGTLNGQSYTLPLGEGAQSEGVEPLELEPTQGDLLAQWSPLFHEVVGLLEIAAPEDDGAVAGPGKCALAGVLAGVGCLGALTIPIAGYSLCADNIGNAYDWCSS